LAEDWKLRSEGTNPCRGVKRYAEHKVERFLSGDELTRLGAALASSAVDGSRGSSAKLALKKRKVTRTREASIDALRLLLLTGCRVGEVLSLRWQHVDVERRLLLLPDSKTGAKSIFLSQSAIELLRSQPRVAGSDYVFAGDREGKPVVSLRKTWERLCAAAKIGNVRLHDLRHSYASIAAAGGMSLPVIGALLGHSQPSTTARYAHLAASPLHEAADAIGARIVAAMGNWRGPKL